MTSGTTFDHIAIIYNPISTGNAPSMARQLEKSIQKDSSLPLKSTLTPTQRAGHAEELAEKISLKYKRPLIISVSGDGGYNEVINGAMSAKNRATSAKPVVAVVGAGNANDHRRVMRDEPILKLINRNQPRPMDLLHISTSNTDIPLERYAHSYIGFGLSPQVALRLNRHKLNKIREIIIVVKTFFTFKPLVVIHKGKTTRYDSLVFANINEMAKVLKFRDEPKIRDGKFELIRAVHTNRFHLVRHLLATATVGADNPPSYRKYSFRLPRAADLQLDGEVERTAAGAAVTITSCQDAIDALY
jgi:diacylglycerol kinase family enzyme